MPKLAEFDAERFVDDAVKVMKKRGIRQAAMAQEIGISSGAISYVFSHRRVSDIELVMSLAWYLGLMPFEYVQRNALNAVQEEKRGPLPSRIYDWKLFGACAALICWGKSTKLAEQVEGMKPNQAAAILKGNGVRDHKMFLELCRIMKVSPTKFLREDRRYFNKRAPMHPKRRRGKKSSVESKQAA